LQVYQSYSDLDNFISVRAKAGGLDVEADEVGGRHEAEGIRDEEKYGDIISFFAGF